MKVFNSKYVNFWWKLEFPEIWKIAIFFAILATDIVFKVSKASEILE